MTPSGQVRRRSRVRRPSASPPLRASRCIAANRRFGPITEVSKEVILITWRTRVRRNGTFNHRRVLGKEASLISPLTLDSFRLRIEVMKVRPPLLAASFMRVQRRTPRNPGRSYRPSGIGTCGSVLLEGRPSLGAGTARDGFMIAPPETVGLPLGGTTTVPW